MASMNAEALVLKPPLDGASRNVVRDFVYGCWCNGRRIGGMQMPPLNDIYVASHALAKGIKVDFLDAEVERDRYVALKASGFSGVKAIAIMSSTQSFARDVETLAEIKGLNPDVKSILFGSHPTFMPQYCLGADAVDYIAQREPEEIVRLLFERIVSGRPVDDVKGAGWRETDGRVVINEPMPFLDMDDLPIPDRTLLPKGADYFNPVVKRMPYATMQTSRGCPGKCVFCTAPEFYGKRVRARSAGKVLEELRQIKALGYREVFFRDETFTAYKQRNVEICEAMIREKLDLSWIANGRVDMIDSETMALMKRAGCHMLKFGVETGSDEMLANYRKGTTCAQAESVFRMAREAGLDTHAHIVLGGPGETPATLRQTIDFVKKLGPSTASFGILTPYPGTRLFDMVAERRPEIRDGSGSNMDNLHVSGFFSEEVCGMGGEELSKWIVKAYREFYWRPGYILKRLSAIRSMDEFLTLAVAGLNIFNFSISGQK